MRIVSIGGGPAGLYFAILMKQAMPSCDIEIIERNRADDTFGWGVVFSDETLGAFESADPESFGQITDQFRYWRDIETYFKGQKTVSTGHGFAALSRKALLLILHRRCRELGVTLTFEKEVTDLAMLGPADLILGCDGVNSWLRGHLESSFQPQLDWRQCRFCWLGTDQPLDAFTFIFCPTEHGLFQVHAYPFEEGLGTWIVECQEETWQRAGLQDFSEADTVAFCQELFAPWLDGHRLLSNRSLWRRFPTVRCQTWHHSSAQHGNVLLLGDAAHTAHFSIGSGTKLAMEDAILLVDVFRRLGSDDIPRVMATYQEERWVDVLKLQKAAQTSLEWFENAARYQEQSPVQFTFNLMTRSKRITYDNLKARDPELIGQLDEDFQARQPEGSRTDSQAAAPPPIFTPLQLRDLRLPNRIVVSPMCQYSAVDGTPDAWHLVHYGSRALGGAGLVFTEMTDVLEDGRITTGCAGMYHRRHVDAWKRIVDFVHQRSASRFGMQLAHAGRKGSMLHPWDSGDRPLTAEEGAWTTIAPSAIPWQPGWQVPKAMDEKDMEDVTAAFVRAATWADEAGFDIIELHMAHGYLLSSFLSPLTNRRQDDYGGSLENRQRFPLQVFTAVRRVWPQHKPMAVRLSASDWLDDEGTTIEESIDTAQRLGEAGCDLIDVSSAGNVPQSEVMYGRMYQVPFAEQIRHATGLPVMAVGAILDEDHANTILGAGRADLAAMARPHLRRPYLTLQAADKYGYEEQFWPGQYLLGRRMPKPEA